MAASSPLLLDDILRGQALHESQPPLIAYPKDGTVADFELFTARDLDLLVGRAAKYYHALGLDSSKNAILSMIGPSDLDYFITKFALSRLGFGLLLLSTRLSPEACLKLTRESKSQVVVQSDSALAFDLGHKTQELDSAIEVVLQATGAIYRDAEWDKKALVILNPDPVIAQHSTAIVYHSSGSTGLPKSIATSHAKLLSPIPTGKGTKALTSSPLCHAFASKLTINSMMVGKCMYLASASVPTTSSSLIQALEAATPDVFLTVPYVLKLVAETEVGVKALQRCKQVVSSGSTLSDELGNRLVQEGVNVETLFAGTEPGLVGTSMNRPGGDKAWDYIRLPPVIQENTHFKTLEDGTFEFVYLHTLPTLNTSNSDDPPGSFHSSDIFKPHATIPHAWKYVGRIDDRVTLSTGEKVLPLPMEGRVREEVLVREAVVFGIDQAVPGLLLFRSEAAKAMSDEEFVDAVWPTIESANAVVEAFGRITKDMVIPLPAASFVPAADKESIIRAKVYKLYGDQIKVAYRRLDKGATGGAKLNLQEIEAFILDAVRLDIGLALVNEETDFYYAGIDSLRAIHLRALILKKLAVVHQFPENIVFEAGNVQCLAKKVFAAMDYDTEPEKNQGGAEMSLMQEIIEKYTSFSPRRVQPSCLDEGLVVFLTGATGSLGAHLLSQLLQHFSVSQVYCLARGGNAAKRRVYESLSARQLLEQRTEFEGKLIIISGDLTQPNLGIGRAKLDEIQERITHIVHAGWPVNFQIGLSAFESHLQALHDLVEMSLSTSGKAGPRLLFCSSISVAMGIQRSTDIPEEPVMDLREVSPTGYAQSKLIGERMLEAARGMNGNATILRIGQVVGDTEIGIWNESEAWPLIIRSALTLHSLPDLQMTCAWLPVDVLASSIVDIALQTMNEPSPTVLNFGNPRRFHWSHDLLPALKNTPLNFKVVTPETWLIQLREYADDTPADEAQRKNPAVKLLNYFEQFFHHQDERDIVLNISKAQACSQSLRAAPDVLEEGLLIKFVSRWLDTWIPDLQ